MVEVATVEALKSFLAAGHGIKLDVNVAFGVGVDSDMNNLAVLLVAFALNLSLQVFDPVVTPSFLFPEPC